MMAYLHKNDIDYYRCMVPCPEKEPEFEGGSFLAPPSLSLAGSLEWLDANAAEGGAYTFILNGDEIVAPKILSYSDKTVSITLLGGLAERTVSLGSNGALFTVGSGVTLKLGNNVSLRGLSGNTSALVRVESGGKLEMQSGSKISGNYNTSSDGYGGGVYVNGGAFAMSGGEISGNSTPVAGGGVYVGNGAFTKQPGGVIYGADESNTLKNTATNGYISGYAVYVLGGRMRNFTVGTEESLDSTKDGATGGWTESIPDNLSLDGNLVWLSANAAEGGAYTFILNSDETVAPRTLSYSDKTVNITILGGVAERTISLSSNGQLFTVGSGVTLTLGDNITLRGRSGNTSALVLVDSGSTLEMKSGSKISGNSHTASGSYFVYGGGVYVSGGTFTMSGGEISGNSVFGASFQDYGGGVYVDSGTFTMNGGEISGNAASGIFGSGGGVCVGGGTFTKQPGGIIYGSNADSSLKNTAYGGNYGYAVYVSSSKKRNTTAGEGVTLDSTKDGAAGGWE
ncbi:MAG: hypothetical protein LBK83_09350 [Treponema sp.]|jgi:hypothetical protein|nr:hypothetical protein [Treponema sp.]